MSEQMTEYLDILFKRAVVELTCQWETLVEIADLEIGADQRPVDLRETLDAFLEAVAKNARCGPESLKRKVRAIQHAMSLGHTAEELKQMGQEKVLSLYQQDKREKQRDQQVWFKLKVPGSLRELLQQEVERISARLDLKTSEAFAEWLYAQLHQATDEELFHSAGTTK